MSLGTGPQRLVTLLEDNWQASRAGRADVPPMYDTTQDFELQKNVVVPLRDREESGINRNVHDVIHIYHPEANPPTSEDRGFNEERLVETVQMDIDLTDRTDHSRPQGDQRLLARERMVGSRDTDSGGTSLGGEAGTTMGGDSGSTLGSGDGIQSYSGVLGETKYLLETVRRGLAEWERVNFDMVNLYLGNSNATASVSVELEQIARNTVQ